MTFPVGVKSSRSVPKALGMVEEQHGGQGPHGDLFQREE